MNRLASPAQLRASFIRWALFLVPAVLLLGFAAGRLGGDASSPWFQSLVKPSIFPPPAAFGIVWSILYAMMGLAAAMVCAAWGSRYRLPAIGFQWADRVPWLTDDPVDAAFSTASMPSLRLTCHAPGGRTGRRRCRPAG